MIIQNCVKILECSPPKYLVSKFTHDFQTYVFKDKTSISVDGGASYIRRAGNLSDESVMWAEWSLDNKSFMRDLRNKLLWNTRGVSGREKPHYVPLIDCSSDHLNAILKTQSQINNTIYEKVIKSILKFRKYC